jgi:hypothetical protein
MALNSTKPLKRTPVRRGSWPTQLILAIETRVLCASQLSLHSYTFLRISSWYVRFFIVTAYALRINNYEFLMGGFSCRAFSARSLLTCSFRSGIQALLGQMGRMHTCGYMANHGLRWWLCAPSYSARAPGFAFGTVGIMPAYLYLLQLAEVLPQLAASLT